MFLQQCLQEANEGLSLTYSFPFVSIFICYGVGHECGNRHHLPEFIRDNKKTLLRTYKRLSDAEKQCLLFDMTNTHIHKVKPGGQIQRQFKTTLMQLLVPWNQWYIKATLTMISH
jgi:hypothetical protein